jgi:hypothetical protein
MAKYLDNKRISIKDAGTDENWLHNWITENPERLEIGNFEIKKQELRQPKNGGGRLDILGYNKSSNTYYEIEVMLGDCDSDHGFRTLDYWAREKSNNPDAFHYAVLVAENLQGRYKTIIETLPQYLPFIAIEIQTFKMRDEDKEYITCRSEIIAQPDFMNKDLDKKEFAKDEAWWRQNKEGGDEYVDICKEIHDLLRKDFPEIQIDFSITSYISIKKGRRVLMYISKRENACYISLPDDGTGSEDEPSERYKEWEAKLLTIDIKPKWDMKNSQYSPISFNLPRAKINHAVVMDLFRDSYKLL